MAKSKISPSAIRKTSSLKFKPAARKSSVYGDIISKMNKLKSGQSFNVAIPKRVKPQNMHNRLTAAFYRFKDRIKPPRGCQFRKRTTNDNQIAIYCERIPK